MLSKHLLTPLSMEFFHLLLSSGCLCLLINRFLLLFILLGLLLSLRLVILLGVLSALSLPLLRFPPCLLFLFFFGCSFLVG